MIRRRVKRRLRRLVGAVGWLVVLTAIAVGLIVVEWRVAADADWSSGNRQLLTAANVLLAGTAAGWLVWCWMLYTVAIAPLRHRRAVAVPAARRRRARPHRIPVRLHRVFGAASGAAMLLTDAVFARPAAAAPPPPSPEPATATLPAPEASPIPAAVDDPVAASHERPSWGWLPTPAVSVATATFALAWAERRRRYQPQLLTSEPRLPLALIPGLPWTGAIDSPPPDLDGSTRAAAPAGPVIGTTGSGWLTVEDLPPRLAIAGPGAAGAARGIFALLASYHAARLGPAPTIMLTEADAHTLLGNHPNLTSLSTLPGIHLAATLTTLLDHLQQPDTTTGPPPPQQQPPAPTVNNGSYPAVRTVLLHLTPLTRGDTQHVDTALTRAGGHAVAIMLDPAGADTRWHITTDGHVRPEPGSTSPSTRSAGAVDRQLAVLAPAAALTLLGHAQSAAGHPPDLDASSQPPTTDNTGPTAPDHTTTQSLPLAAATDTPLRLRLLGSPTLLVHDKEGGTQPVHIRRGAGWLLLVRLAIDRHGASSADLHEALWPDAHTSSARNLLRTNLSELRIALQSAAGGPVLRNATNSTEPDRTHHWLDPTYITVDLWQLHDLIRTALATTNHDQRHTLLRRATLLATGDLAHGMTADWIRPHRESTIDDFADLFHTLANTEPDPHTASALLRQALRVAPHTESLAQALMRQQTAAGDIAAVHRTYTTLADRLADLRTEPSPTTKALFERLTHAATPGHLSATPDEQPPP